MAPETIVCEIEDSDFEDFFHDQFMEFNDEHSRFHREGSFLDPKAIVDGLLFECNLGRVAGGRQGQTVEYALPSIVLRVSDVFPC